MSRAATSAAVSFDTMLSKRRPSMYIPFARIAGAAASDLGLAEIDLLDERAGRGERLLERRAQRIHVGAECVHRAGQVHQFRARVHFPEEALAGRGGALRGRDTCRGDRRERTERCRPASGSVCQGCACRDYRLVLLSPSLSQPLFAHRGDIGPAGSAAAAPGDAKEPDEPGADYREDCEICVRAHSRSSIATLVPSGHTRQIRGFRHLTHCAGLSEPHQVEATLQELQGWLDSQLSRLQLPKRSTPNSQVLSREFGTWKLGVESFEPTARSRWVPARRRPCGRSARAR